MTDKEETSPFTRPSFILASIFMGLLVVAGAYFAVNAWMTETLNVAQADTLVSESVPVLPVSPGVQSECAPSAPSDNATLLPEPEQVMVREGLSVPKVESVGPFVENEGLPRCWAHSPQGAVLASVTVTKQLFTQENPVEVVTTYAEDTPQRQQLLDAPAPAQTETKPQMLVLGYKYNQVEGDFVSVEIALGAHWISDTPISVTTEMIWNDQAQDWKLVLNPAGWNMQTLPYDIHSAGFTEWKS